MPSPNLLLSSPPPLLAQLKRQTDELLSAIVRANSNTQFARGASELTEFRQATANLVSGIDNDSLSDIFRKTVPFITYNAYAPFIAKAFENPCKASSILDLLAPGLPDYIACSSSTSGGVQKHFPKYDCSSALASSDAGRWYISDPNRRRATAFIKNLRTDQLSVEDDEEKCPAKKIYTCCVSAMCSRNELYLSPEHDEEKMGTFILDHAAPYATAFIGKWRSFLLIHALFAVASRSLENVSTLFICTFVDMIRYLDMEFDLVVDCIDNGTIPSLDGVEEVRRYLEPNLFPDPERAAELRSLGRPSSCPGWCGRVWPNLRLVTGDGSGSFASYVPLARWYLGPNTDMSSGHYGSTEAPMLALAYNPPELNLYKFTKTRIIEFLDIEKNGKESSSDSINSLSQIWEVEAGKRYEAVVTNSDGLWRYRMGDVIEIVGFDPTDGIPIMEFVERRNVIMRFQNFMLSEKELMAAMSSAISSMPLVNVVDWTATLDERQMPATIGFFVELAGNEVSDLVLSAPDRILDALLQLQSQISFALTIGFFRKPTIRLVRAGTFSDFLQVKLDEGSKNVGQIKVPVVLPKAEYVTWFSNQVVRELRVPLYQAHL